MFSLRHMWRCFFFQVPRTLKEKIPLNDESMSWCRFAEVNCLGNGPTSSTRVSVIYVSSYIHSHGRREGFAFSLSMVNLDSQDLVIGKVNRHPALANLVIINSLDHRRYTNLCIAKISLLFLPTPPPFLAYCSTSSIHSA
jgi:hypothetical protein